MASANVTSGIRTWLLFGLQLYNSVQPNGTSPTTLPQLPSNSSLRYNQMQTVGTHNSYHITPDQKIVNFLDKKTTKILLGKKAAQELPDVWEATMKPLSQQLQQFGVRQLEIDCYPDPKGGLFSTSAGRRLVGESGYINQPSLLQPGWKVLHVPDIDMNTTCWTLLECLQSIRTFTRAVPNHEPIAVYFEMKDDDLDEVVGPAGAQLAPVILKSLATPGPDTYIKARNITTADVLDMEGEILSVFSPDAILTPDKLRGDANSLKEALTADGGSGWPKIDDMRGKVMFVVVNTYTKRYLKQYPGLRGAMFFVSDITPTSDNVVFLEPANERYDSTQIKEAAKRVTKYVKQGYIVRARSDYDTREARANDPSRAQALLAAGAHWLSTDFPSQPTMFNSSYQVRLPSAFTCNPVTTGSSLGNLSATFGTANAFDAKNNASDATPICS